jgi:hypothetical protein
MPIDLTDVRHLYIEKGYIACGGESDLLKVLKLETPSGPDALLQVNIVLLFNFVFSNYYLFVLS